MPQSDERGSERSESGLTHEQVAEVLARAAELDASGSIAPMLPELVAPSVVEEAAVEAGLSRTAVRRALSELVPVRPGLPQERPALPTGNAITAVRRVPGDPDRVRARVERFLRRQVFAQQRIFDSGSRWVPRRGLVATTRRAFDVGGRLHLDAVRAVDVQVVADPLRDGYAVVRIDLDVTPVRQRQAGVAAGGAATGAAVGGTLVVLNGLEMVLLGAPLGVSIAAAGWWGGRLLARRSVTEIDVAINGFLDRLEHDAPPTERRGTGE
ncbi:hypothetical protein [Actinomarinicola tropica]|uniref:Uncharacterized protein n=1 Tax=Actinomarinicola tropica TaxID=2789776 RepID=A0A5Q2RL37_9ACTN|nr:hypothetical protein [Actinomarinicola tropica]QGG95146.1 hypothetical protein GH723_08565 [Actinomarinicola tropica]